MRYESSLNRRGFLRWSAASVAIGPTFQSFAARIARADLNALRSPGYGPLKPAIDASTGLKLIQLPEGFRYMSFGWTGDSQFDGTPTPSDHDGMAVTHDQDGLVTMSRNHEIAVLGSPPTKPAITYDRRALGGCTNLMFDTNAGKWVKSWTAIAGTVRNCAGGATPWGTWLTCEETTLGPGDRDNGQLFDYGETHGWIFEVPARGDADPKPLKSMGRMWHEAVVIDPISGIAYETEDREDAGFYRFLPHTPSKLAEGGRLQMLRAKGKSVLKKGLRVGAVFDVDWVDIEDPLRADSPSTKDRQGVYDQGRAAGGSTFARLEGTCYGHGKIYVTATAGGDAERGQVWEFDPYRQTLTLIFESPGESVLDMPDNMCSSPRGGILLCEDGNSTPQRLQGLTEDGRLFTFAANNIDFSNVSYKKFEKKDFRSAEWCGATFSNSGKWLFVNIQRPGVTFAITGPWQDGLV
ncbi:MAG: PhoX family protein [Pirellulales bacterium]|nr:PhoX family protein [Pirellulales bacterium]